ncbi:MAG: VCBS repeat-containing protein [Caldilineaceae bacterium]|nr:VCBS repeat-containing protein [Caldilineaceae bacterium]
MHNYTSSVRHLIFLTLLTPLIMLCLITKPTLAQEPDFDHIDDPLHGEYELFTVDDLVIFRTKAVSNSITSSNFSQVDNFVLETADEKISKQTKQAIVTAPCFIPRIQDPKYGPPGPALQPQKTRVGRFFNLGYDVIVTLAPTANAQGDTCATTDGSPNMALYIHDIHSVENVTSPFTMPATWSAVAMDDFNLDGFDDLVIMSSSEIFVATAADVNDWSTGMTFGPKIPVTPTPVTRYDPSTGDFNGDGLVDVAWISENLQMHFATVCPSPVVGTVCAGAEPLAVIVDPLNAGTSDIVLNKDANDCFAILQGEVTITAGQFTSTPVSQLITIDLVQKNQVGQFPKCAYKIHWYEFDKNFKTTEIQSVILLDSPVSQDIKPINFYARSARLNWFDDAEQAIIAVGSPTTSSFLYTVSFANAKMTVFQVAVPADYINGMAIGRFASIADNPNTQTDFNQQIAILRNNGAVEIYGMSNPPNDFTPKLLTSTTLNGALGFKSRGAYEHTWQSWLVAGDLQGRSARLGAPTVVRMTSHSQPSVILGAPPMHVDYIQPDASTSADWDIVNFSVIPSGFNAQYDMTQTNSNQSSNTNKTSYTYATKLETEASAGLKLPYLPDIAGSIKTTAEDKYETVNDENTFTQGEFTYNAATTTGFGDEIWYSRSSFNVYAYPVLGQTVCPADNGNCSAAEEEQLYVMFSGPDNSGAGPAAGATTEWYQPVHEPGNIFSYPWNETQLRKQMGAIDLLSGPQHFYTDDSSQAQTLSWRSGEGQDLTVGTINNHSDDTEYSMTAELSIGEVVEVGAKGSINYNESSAISTMNQSTSSIGASQGIAIAKPNSFLKFALYQYRVEPFIFGRTPPANVVDNVKLTESLQTYGPLQAAFAANPVDSNSGSWWRDSNNPYRQNIDVALNHPVRWSKTTQQNALNCLDGSYCVDFNDPEPNNLWNSEFYWMRGLFVTVNSLNGPQRIQAKEGDTIFLQARVYNYSLKDMAADALIKMRFYRQEVDGTNPTGNSVLIDEVTVGSLPGFNSDTNPDTPNWTTGHTSFDTAGLGNKSFIFWVVVWAEDGNGAMIAELAGHGLSAQPGAFTRIGDVPLAHVTLGGEAKTFSNNVGYLHAPFYVAPAAPMLQPPGPLKDFVMQPLQLSSSAPEINERIIISTNMQAVGAPADSIHIRFSTEGSSDGGAIFDEEVLPHITANGIAPISVPYRPQRCGEHIIIVEARNAEGAVAQQSMTFSIDCPLYLPAIFHQEAAAP